MAKREVIHSKRAVLEELRKNPDIAIVLKHLHISTPVFYSWKRDDHEFWEKVLLTLEIKRDIVSGIAIDKLIGLIEKGNLPAIKYWLEHNEPTYRRKSPLADPEHKCEMPQSLADLIAGLDD